MSYISRLGKGKTCISGSAKLPTGQQSSFIFKTVRNSSWTLRKSGLMLGIVHTMEELHFTGNCLKGSRPILSFDAAFEERPHLKVIKKMFLDTFGVPQGARKSKPFIDHVMGFSVADGKIWVRNYQISEEEGSLVKTGDEVGDGKKSKGAAAKAGANTEIKLIEIGPRFVLTPIVIQNGSFGGEIIFANREFVSPNQIRSDLRKAKASRHNARAEQTVERLSRKGELGLRSTSGSKPFENELNHKSVFV
ncbi:brix domain-containing protein 2 [Moelleriella libera RCEF 2490]|uniref:Brix domain-containing protein 2 n=1 Tax=Moelleriella libera RCEF 2490 TaxID=1081109 RepID=A0A168B7B6_9HYPO|nr:brix domain-containing protein 2 [Moelleriella libera RCEF 2490]